MVYLTILLSGPLPKAATRHLPLLARCLKRGHRRQGSVASREALLWQLFNPDATGPIPVAALSYLGETGLAPPGWCLRADPVHLGTTRHELVLLAGDDIEPTRAEAEALAAYLLQGLDMERRWRLQVLAPSRWYLFPDTVPRLDTVPLSQVLGHNIDHLLSAGADGMRWRVYLNEVQMLLHTAPLNRTREAIGKPLINSLWFWGGGNLPPSLPQRWDVVWAEEPYVTGLATLAPTPHRTGTPTDADFTAGGRFLWIQTPSAAAPERLEALLQRVQAGIVGELCLLQADGTGLMVRRGDLSRWWAPWQRRAELPS